MTKLICRADKRSFLLKFVLVLSLSMLFGTSVFSQNDNCANAIEISVPNNGFALGTFNSSINDISAATVQTGEVFAPAILVGGQTQKSIWYKFSLPTNRSVKVTLAQNGSAIQAGDVGFSVYKTNTCLPAVAQISNKLTPIGLFGSTFHPCVETGDYLVQVSSKASANGPVYIVLELASPTALYDKQAGAYQFGTLGAPNYAKSIVYPIDCQTIEDASEACTSINNYQQFTKSTWHTFTTPAYFDYIGVMLSGTGTPTYFSPSGVNEKIGYNLYQGDARTLPFSGLTLVNGCDSLLTNGYNVAKKTYRCTQLQPNTTYSIQLFFKQDFNNAITLAVTFDGTSPTQAPQPITSLVAASNNLGTLASSATGVFTYATDQLGCNAAHSLHPCNPSLPATGVVYNGQKYNLSTFFTFTLSGTSRVNIGSTDVNPPYRFGSTPLLMRLFAQDITANCSSLDTNTLVYPAFLSNIGFSLDCVPPGNYTLQVLGRDTAETQPALYYGYLSFNNYVHSFFADLGKKFNLSINVASRKTASKYDLKTAGAFDTLNAVGGLMVSLTPGSSYTAKPDTFGCANTVLPMDTACLPYNSKAIYRELKIADTGVLFMYHYSGGNTWEKLYFGNADSLATVQNVHSYPQKITGLIPYSKCFSSSGSCSNNFCVIPGTYTLATFGSSVNIGQGHQAKVIFSRFNTAFNSLENANNMGNLAAGSGLISTLDYFGCRDNAISINGFAPCMVNGVQANKAIYRQFYLMAPATVAISGYHNGNCGYSYGHTMTLFKGRATDGAAALTVMPAPFQCFYQSATTQGSCNVLEAGWYTVVSYATGASYQNPIFVNNYNYVGQSDQITISTTAACPAPKYNRPYKAAVDPVTGQPFLIEWAPRLAHTNAIPKTDTTYSLPRENFNCSTDTPFSAQHLPFCNNAVTKASYYVFRTTQESYVQINTKGYWGAVYAGNARTDSASFDSTTLIQPCLASDGFIQLCRLKPGAYTLVVFATTAQNCNNVNPTIYIDKMGTSRFDFARNAYDFGMVPPDSIYHPGKVQIQIQIRLFTAKKLAEHKNIHKN